MVQEALSNYLESSRLSLSHLAKRVNISKSYLSEILGGKKNPSLEKGLQILKNIGAEANIVDTFVTQHNTQISEQYVSLADELDQKNKWKKLNREVANRLAKDVKIFNLFKDILDSDHGISKGDIISRHGIDALKELEFFTKRGAIDIKDSYFTCNNEFNLEFGDISSFKFIKTVAENEVELLEEGEAEGKMRFRATNISEEGFMKLNSLIEKQFKEMNDLIEQHQVEPKNESGKRVVFSNLSSCIKNFMFVCLIGFFLSASNNLMAGNDIGGGSNGSGKGSIGQLNTGFGWGRLHSTPTSKTASKVKLLTTVTDFRKFIPKRYSTKNLGKKLSGVLKIFK